ncbi:DUF2142 domain-containing protein [Rugosimonospora acidiphila]|uniref:DUF2142 domain-containing protein n=1 Tax=Rugosimonospora acidiphila TaxID=556531 RepID=UPI0031EA9A7C
MRRWFWLSLTAFFLMGTAWAIALPANGTYDEKDHVARAYAVVTGQLTTDKTIVNRRGDVTPAFLAPASLLPSGSTVDCTWAPLPPKPASCQQWTSDRHKILTQSAAATYSPIYYLPVGLPLLVAPDMTGIILARLISVLLAALLLACSVGAAMRMGSRLLPVGIMLVCTPLVMNLASSINPNGLEIVSGILVFSSLLALVRAPDERLDDRSVRRLLVMACAGSLLLLTLRELGPALLAIDVVACALLARRGRIGALWRRRDLRWALGVCWAVGLVFAAGWLEYSGFANIATNARAALHLSLGQELHEIASQRIPFFVRQIVGEFDYGETHVPTYVIAAWYLLMAALVVPCLRYARLRFGAVLVALLAVCLAMLVVLDLHFLPEIGWFSQGRYALPSLVGVVLAAASTNGFERRLAGRRWAWGYPAALGAGATVLNVYALSRVMTRFRAGVAAPLNPFSGSWHPQLGSVLPLLAAFAGSALLVVVVAFAAGDHRPAEVPATAPDQSRASAAV